MELNLKKIKTKINKNTHDVVFLQKLEVSEKKGKHGYHLTEALAIGYLKLNKISKANEYFTKLSRQNDIPTSSRLNLAKFFEKQSNFRLALQSYLIVFEKNPRNEQVALSCLRCLFLGGHPAHAISLFQKIQFHWQSNPLFVEIYLHALLDSYQFYKLKNFIAEHKPWKFLETKSLNSLAPKLLNADFYLYAGLFSLRIVRKDITNAKVLNNLAMSFKLRGKTKSAESVLEFCKKVEPEFVSTYRNLALLINFKKHPHFIKELHKKLDENNDTEDRALLHHSLFTGYHTLNKKDLAFHHLSSCNKLIEERTQADFQKELHLLKQGKSIYEKYNYFKDYLDTLGSSEVKPIFIIGLPRSGTSIIEKILSVKEEITCFGELDYVGSALSKADFSTPENTKEIILRLRDEYSHKVHARCPDVTSFTDKMPSNFRWVPILKAAFPNAKFIHTHRSKYNSFWSCYKTLFADTSANTFCYSKERFEEYFAGYRSLIRDIAGQDHIEIFDLPFEQLLSSTEVTLKNLITYLGFEWSDLYLDHTSSKYSLNTASSLQVRQPLYSTDRNEFSDYAKFFK